jgi:predicted  nucleic acid-binding Zn-ribbon protein
MFFFRKKKEESDAPNQDSMEDDLTVPQAAPQAAAPRPAGDASFAADVAKLKASVEAFSDVRKATNERLSRLSEQVGELRAMIADRDRTINQIELKATKASDLVEAVHPDQQMLEIRKGDAKIDALKAMSFS